MPYKWRRFTLRAEQEIIDKFNEIAKSNERSMNQELVYLMKNYIKDYENKNGTITINGNVANVGQNNGTINM